LSKRANCTSPKNTTVEILHGFDFEHLTFDRHLGCGNLHPSAAAKTETLHRRTLARYSSAIEIATPAHVP